VPGYSSHRVAIFLCSGIFWGQCMEICGRFHHWMPIVLYFMKRDLFFLWCTHFIHYSVSDNTFTGTDKHYSNKLYTASYDLNTWASDLKFLV
jgi:heme/copper-type cytochrome/quinol oxidase subunit 2